MNLNKKDNGLLSSVFTLSLFIVGCQGEQVSNKTKIPAGTQDNTLSKEQPPSSEATPTKNKTTNSPTTDSKVPTEKGANNENKKGNSTSKKPWEINNLSTGTQLSYEPLNVGIDLAGNAYVVWYDQVDSGSRRVALAKKSKTGAWEAASYILSAACYPSLAVTPAGVLHILALMPCSGGNYKAFYIRSSDGGKNWTKPLLVSNNIQRADAPMHIVASDETHRVFASFADVGGSLFLVNSKDGGTTWSTPNQINSNVGNGLDPALALSSNGKLHIVFEAEKEKGVWHIFYRSFDPISGGFTGVRDVSTSDYDHNEYPNITSNGDEVYIVWTTNQSGLPSAVYFRSSHNAGKSWKKAVKLKETSHLALPNLSVGSKGQIGVVIDDKAIWYSDSSDLGQTFSTFSKIDAPNTFGAEAPAIAFSEDQTVYVVWRQRQDEKATNTDPYVAVK